MEARQVLAGLLTGVVVLGGLYFTYRTLTSTARISLLQRYVEAVTLLTKTDLEKLGGVHILAAINLQPEGENLHIGPLLTAFANDASNSETAAGKFAKKCAEKAHQ